ncbi:MAG: hypothetical protein M3N46_10610, partial [Actinomycetota bacterium]|nr:hypothetical protein [Actinomycetota bacterium]
SGSTSTSTTTSAAVPDPCTLLSDAEVTSSFDSGPKHGTASASGAVKHCDYGDGVVVSIDAMTAADFASTTGAIAGIRPVSINGQPVYIHDPGPAAGATTDFYVGKDGLRVEFQCQDPEDNGIPAMTDLSALLLARI